MACCWYYIGLTQLEIYPDTWLTMAFLYSHSSFEVYITSLYWAFTTMTTVGYGDIYPITTVETVFAIVNMGISCAMFAYILGSIGSIVSKSTARSTEYKEQILCINLYSINKQLPVALKTRMRQYLDSIWLYKKTRILAENEIIGLLSEPLQEEIFIETRGHTINFCAIFSKFTKHFRLELTKLLEMKSYAPGDLLFEQGESSNVIFFIQRGSVELYHSNTKSIFSVATQGKYFGEIAFFSLLPRSSSARCLEFVQTMALSRKNTNCLFDKNQEAKGLFQYFQEECSNFDLSSLNIECYFCHQLGHTASKCAQSIIRIEEETFKSNWINSRKNGIKVNLFDDSREIKCQKHAKRKEKAFLSTLNDTEIKDSIEKTSFERVKE